MATRDFDNDGFRFGEEAGEVDEPDEVIGEEEDEEEEPDPKESAALTALQQLLVSAGPPMLKKSPSKKRKPIPINLNLSNCKYDVLRIVAKRLGWREVDDEDDWQVYWTDTSVGLERIITLKKTQKINHFTGMLEICRKKMLAKNMARMSQLFPEHFDYTPDTYILPKDMAEFLAVFGKKKRSTYILKPDAGCQGRGIALAQTAEQAVQALADWCQSDNVVAQKYLTRPFLINGYKFDLRVYMLVLSVSPLRIFIYDDGLARFCTERYAPPTGANLNDVCMHLTNYAINKQNEKFDFNTDAGATDQGSKWTLKGLREWMTTHGHDFAAAWAKIQDIAVKTVISIQALLESNYKSAVPDSDDGYACFELLGLDVILDAKLNPILLEVNHSPSFTTDTPLDLAIKEALIYDTLMLARVDGRAIKRQLKADREEARARLYRAGSATSGGARPSRGASGDPPGAATAGPGDSSGSGDAAAREASRAASDRKRERYERAHCGGYTRICPAADPRLQTLYDRLIADAARAFHSNSFAARARDNLTRLKEAKAAATKGADDAEAKAAAQATPQARAMRAAAASAAARQQQQAAAVASHDRMAAASPAPQSAPAAPPVHASAVAAAVYRAERLAQLAGAIFPVMLGSAQRLAPLGLV